MFGGAVYIEGAAPSLINNMIARNSSSMQAGGIYIENATPLIRNNTIAYNNLGGNGEGIYLAARSCPTITNNIIIGNGFGIASVATFGPTDAQPVITHNDIWDNRSGDIVGITAANNISADPLFIRGRDGAFYLSQKTAGQPHNSPALDAGTDSAGDVGLDERTTAVQDIPDAGMVDLGYHYRALFYKVYMPIIIDELP
jgi:parallel beta-helix repeat protein